MVRNAKKTSTRSPRRSATTAEQQHQHNHWLVVRADSKLRSGPGVVSRGPRHRLRVLTTTALVIAPRSCQGNCPPLGWQPGGGVWRTDERARANPTWTCSHGVLALNSVGAHSVADPNDASGNTLTSARARGTAVSPAPSGCESVVGIYKTTTRGNTDEAADRLVHSTTYCARTRATLLGPRIQPIVVDPDQRRSTSRRLVRWPCAALSH